MYLLVLPNLLSKPISDRSNSFSEFLKRLAQSKIQIDCTVINLSIGMAPTVQFKDST